MRQEVLWSLGFMLGAVAPASAEDLAPARSVQPQTVVRASPVHFLPAELLLGEQKVGVAGPVRRIQVRNAGSESARLGGWSVLGDASIESDCPGEIEAGAQCELRLRFIPSNPGQRRATVMAVDEHGGLLTLSVSAKGVVPAEPSFAASSSSGRRRLPPPRARRRRERMRPTRAPIARPQRQGQTA